MLGVVMEMNQPKRKQIRLEHYDYSQPGAYFITVCTKDRAQILWTRPVGADSIRPQDAPTLSHSGRIVETAIREIHSHYPNVFVDHFAVMPNHIHLLLRIEPEASGRMISAPTVPVIVGQLKRWVSRQVGRPIWQKSFYEHVIRNDASYLAIAEYIQTNPARWDSDEYFA